MCRLGGEFAGLLAVELPADGKPPLLPTFERCKSVDCIL